MIAVTGATGGVGGRVARALAERGLPLRLVVRDASRAPELGAEVAVAEYRDGTAMRAAFAGAETVYLISGSDTVERILGRPPRSLADVLREHPERLAHLRP
jgi:NAD(P)H dehydrogenase (quinone)